MTAHGPRSQASSRLRGGEGKGDRQWQSKKTWEAGLGGTERVPGLRWHSQSNDGKQGCLEEGQAVQGTAEPRVKAGLGFCCLRKR